MGVLGAGVGESGKRREEHPQRRDEACASSLGKASSAGQAERSLRRVLSKKEESRVTGKLSAGEKEAPGSGVGVRGKDSSFKELG